MWTCKPLCDVFTIKNDLQEGHGSLSLLFNFALEYAIRKVKANHKLLQFNFIQQVVIYADNVNLQGQSIHTISFISPLEGEWSRSKRWESWKYVSVPWTACCTKSQYTGCPRRSGQNFGRVFLMLKYTDITQNTYIQSWMVTEIMAREVWNFDSCYTLTDYQIHIKTGRNMWFL